MTICELIPAIKRSGSVSYLLSISPRIILLQCLSASLLVDEGIVTTSTDTIIHNWRRKHLLSNLSQMCIDKCWYVQNNHLQYLTHKVLAFQHGIYFQLFLIPKKWTQIICAGSIVCAIFLVLFYFVDDNVFFPMTLIEFNTILTGNKIKLSIWTGNNFRMAQRLILSSEWSKNYLLKSL